MANAGTLLQVLRGLRKDELQAIPHRCDWCNVRETGRSKRELSKSIRDSVERSVASGDLTYRQAMRDLRDQVLVPGSDSVEQKIRTRLRGFEAVAQVGEEREEEEWFSAQLYGALDAEIERPYDVFLEYQIDPQSRCRADIYVRSIDPENDSGDFLVEVKRASSIDNGKEIQRQLARYHRQLRKRPDHHRERTFLCVIAERTDPEASPTKSTPVSEYVTSVPLTVDEIPAELERTEVLTNALDREI